MVRRPRPWASQSLHPLLEHSWGTQDPGFPVYTDQTGVQGLLLSCLWGLWTGWGVHMCTPEVPHSVGNLPLWNLQGP